VFFTQRDGVGASVTADLPVNLNLTPICNVDFSHVSFGNYVPEGVNGGGTMYIYCSYSVIYQIALDAGANYGSTRNMVDLTTGTFSIGYMLYRIQLAQKSGEMQILPIRMRMVLPWEVAGWVYTQ